jgi:hypothetical protein
MPKISLELSRLSEIVLGFAYPNPDDPGPLHGPIGPWPPVWRYSEPHPIPWVHAPHPDPWTYRSGPRLQNESRPVRLARDLVARASLQSAVAEATGTVDHAVSSIRRSVADFEDDWCGTPRPKFPRPKGLELLIIGALLQQGGAQIGLRDVGTLFQDAAGKFMTAGLEALAAAEG